METHDRSGPESTRLIECMRDLLMVCRQSLNEHINPHHNA